jgi:hypothetical protein
MNFLAKKVTTNVLKTPTDLMKADMSVTTWQQISAQQRMSRLKNKVFLSAYCKGDEIHQGCVNDALQGGGCYCHGANAVR